MKRVATAIAAIALIGAPAFAADMAVKAPPAAPTPVYSLTGWYVGANIGGGWGHRDVTFTPNDAASAAFLSGTSLLSAPAFNVDGVLGGVQLGYNWQFQRSWLIGFETDFDWSNLRGSSTVGANISDIPVAAPLAVSQDEHITWFGTVRGRLGWLPYDNVLLYGTGGFAYGRIEHAGSIMNVSNSNNQLGVPCQFFSTCFAGSSTSSASGWTAGGGVELAFWGHWSLKGEYLYVSLDNSSVTETVAGSPASINANFGRANFNVLRVELNYQLH